MKGIDIAILLRLSGKRDGYQLYLRYEDHFSQSSNVPTLAESALVNRVC